MNFNFNKVFLISNNEYLKAEHFKTINFSNSDIIHFNYGTHRKHFNHIDKSKQYIALNNRGYKEFYNYNPNLNSFYNGVIFLLWKEFLYKKLWMNYIIDYSYNKDIWIMPRKYFNIKKEIYLPSSGFKVIHYLWINNQQNINLVGFTGKYKKPIKGHKFQYE
jgi:hypothetical protein